MVRVRQRFVAMRKVDRFLTENLFRFLMSQNPKSFSGPHI